MHLPASMFVRAIQTIDQEEARRDLIALDRETYTSWSGENPGHTKKSWEIEGDRMRAEYRKELMRRANGGELPPPDELKISEFQGWLAKNHVRM